MERVYGLSLNMRLFLGFPFDQYIFQTSNRLYWKEQWEKTGIESYFNPYSLLSGDYVRNECEVKERKKDMKDTE